MALAGREKTMKWFRDDHLQPGPPRDVARLLGDVARELDQLLPLGDQGTMALNLLLLAKDAAVRATLDRSVPDY